MNANHRRNNLFKFVERNRMCRLYPFATLR